MVDRHLRAREWQRGFGVALLALCLGACGAEAHRASLDPRAHPAERYVVGRVLIFRSGAPARVTRATSGLSSLSASGPLTTLSLRNLASNERFAIPIENEQGWFAAQLPGGSYGVGMTHYIWFFDVPARVEVPDDPRRCYVGSLGVNLFAHSSAGAAWARAAGGVIPKDDIDAAVADQRGAAAAYAGTALPACLMTLAAPPAGNATRQPPPDTGGSR